MATTLQFVPFASTVTPDFWTAFSKLKIDTLQLTEEPVELRATYRPGRTLLDRETGKLISLQPPAFLGPESLVTATTSQQQQPQPQQHEGAGDDADRPGRQWNHECTLRGSLTNYNTIEAFKNADKQALFAQAASRLWQRVGRSKTSSSSSRDYEDQSITAAELNTVSVVAFADLKKYTFYYWFAFPAFIAKPAWTLESPWTPLDGASSSSGLSGHGIVRAHGKHCQQHKPEQEGNACLVRRKPGSADELETARLAECGRFFAEVPDEERFLLFVDPASDSNAVGWPLRNMLAYLNVQHGISRIRVVALREDASASLLGTVALQGAQEGYGADPRVTPAAAGWEKNAAGKLGPRMADLGALMDPKRLADQAVDLNLKLMRWRILPSLDLERIKSTRCLLLGSGTLGCYVSRCLMAWGVNKITLVDSGKVSYSNPVRQPLFEFRDCFEGGKPKAACAAEALKRIYPSVDATGVQLAIPMPGHPVPCANVDLVKQSVKDLEKLVDDHDVVYLLMDSRESRWLPTLLGAAKGKLVMNAALGFDSFVVARHGMLDQPIAQRLGCYYCTDIVAPTDSLSDRTLDQMCTVTRPGLAAIASATAVELMVSVLQHPEGPPAPSECEKPSNASQWSSVLGAVPHTIRGFLSDFKQLKITGQAYSNCTACSEKVIDAYRAEGFEMLNRAFEDAKYLEQLTGLDKLQEATLDVVDWDEDEEEYEDGV